MRYCRCLRFQFRSRYFRWNGNCHGDREDENHRTSQGVILVVATGNPASQQACLAPMVALHRCIFLRCGLAFGRALRSRMSVGETNRSGAAGHPTRLPGGGPRRSPQQHRGHQAHPCAAESSRSDRDIGRQLHL